MANTVTVKVVNTGLGNELEDVPTYHIIGALAAVNYSLMKFIHQSVMDVSDRDERETLDGLAIVGKIFSEVLAVRSLCGQLDGGDS